MAQRDRSSADDQEREDRREGRLVAIPGQGEGPGHSGRSRAGRRVSDTYRLPDPPPEPSEIYDPRDSDNEPAPHPDHWSTESLIESDTYSKSSFYPKTSHEGEDSIQTRFAFSSAAHHLAQTIVQQRRFPQITTMQDLIRDAIHHRLHDYAMMMNRPSDDPDVVEMERVLSEVMFANRLAMEQAKRESAKALYGKLAEEVSHHQKSGNDNKMRRLVRQSIPHITRMDEEWRDQAMELIEPHARRLGIEI
jgi:hypothetical protein